jgi:DNA-binding transcriptional regulator YiaG
MYKNECSLDSQICTSEQKMSPEELRQVRRRLGMTQAQFAERSRREIAQIFRRTP